MISSYCANNQNSLVFRKNNVWGGSSEITNGVQNGLNKLEKPRRNLFNSDLRVAEQRCLMGYVNWCYWALTFPIQSATELMYTVEETCWQHKRKSELLTWCLSSNRNTTGHIHLPSLDLAEQITCPCATIVVGTFIEELSRMNLCPEIQEWWKEQWCAVQKHTGTLYGHFSKVFHVTQIENTFSYLNMKEEAGACLGNLNDWRWNN